MVGSLQRPQLEVQAYISQAAKTKGKFVAIGTKKKSRAGYCTFGVSLLDLFV